MVSRSLIAAAGFVWGLSRNLNPPLKGQAIVGVVNDPVINRIEDRLAALEVAFLRLSAGASVISGRQSDTAGASLHHVEARESWDKSEKYVTREELAEALEGAEKRLESNLEEQFRTQKLAIGSLRTMITDTDMLLERLLERLETSADRVGETVDREL